MCGSWFTRAQACICHAHLQQQSTNIDEHSACTCFSILHAGEQARTHPSIHMEASELLRRHAHTHTHTHAHISSRTHEGAGYSPGTRPATSLMTTGTLLQAVIPQPPKRSATLSSGPTRLRPGGATDGSKPGAKPNCGLAWAAQSGGNRECCKVIRSDSVQDGRIRRGAADA
jgi:hypothetical protein